MRPKAELGEYKGLEVGKPEAEVPAERIDEELERLREGFGSLNPVERAAADGDVVVIDYEGTVDGEAFEGGSGTDMTVELGSERLLPEFEKGLVGKSAGEEADLDVSFPDDYGAEDLAGKAAVFHVKVSEVREKELPELDDDFAQSASEFDTLEELRGEIRDRMAEIIERRSEMEFRDAAVEAAAENATIDLPHDLIHARAHELWERFERTLQARGIDPQMYAQMQGRDRHEMISEGDESAEKTPAARGHTGRSRRGGGHRADRRGTDRGAWPGGRQAEAREGAREAARERAGGAVGRGGPPAQGGRADRRLSQADPGRSGRGARRDLDAGEDERAPTPRRRRARKALDPGFVDSRSR